MSALDSFTYDNLIGGDHPLVTDSDTIVSGAGNLPRGRVLGKITAGACPTEGTADGDNTGNGTVDSVTADVDVKVGTYKIECITAATNSGTFKVVNPDGVTIDVAVITGGAGGTATVDTNEINATITDAGTDFAVGDFFTIDVPAGSGKLTSVDSTAINGSAKPYAVLADDRDATAADQVAPVYLAGQFNDAGLSFGGSDAIADHRDAMRDRGMYTRASLGA
jgi:hypothetical protein